MIRRINRFTATLILFATFLLTAQCAYSISSQDSSKIVRIDGKVYVLTSVERIKASDSLGLRTKADSAYIESLLKDLFNCRVSDSLRSEAILELQKVGVLYKAQNEALNGKYLAEKEKAASERRKKRSRTWALLASIGLNVLLLL
jgi:hypothetical protein